MKKDTQKMEEAGSDNHENTSEVDVKENRKESREARLKHDLTGKMNSHQNPTYSRIETACANFLNGRSKKDCFKISNDEVVDLFQSIYEEFSKAQIEQTCNEVGSMPNQKQKLHEIICSKLRLPQESILRGNFSISSFKIDVVEDSDRDKLHKKCELKNLTVENVITANGKLKGMTTRRKNEKLRRILCKEVGVTEEIVDLYSLELKVKNKEKDLKRLKDNKRKKKIETMMRSVFYLPLKKKDFIKDLQNTPENFDLHYLQKRSMELTNGLLVDVFEAVKGDHKQLRNVLCNRFAKLWSIKSKTLNERVLKTVNEAEKLKESGKDEEFETFMNLPFFETVYSVKSSLFNTQKKETGQNTRSVTCMDTENENCSPSPASLDNPAEIQVIPESIDSDNENYSPLCCSDDSMKEDEKPSLKLDVHEGYESEDTMSGKGKRTAYNNAFKLRVVQFAENESNRSAGRKFGVSEKSIRDWRKAKDIMQQRPQNKKRNLVSRTKDLEMIEKDLCKWFLYYQGKGSILGKKEIMMKAKVLSKDPKYKIDRTRYFFGKTWCTGFLKSNNLILSRNKRNSIGKESKGKKSGKEIFDEDSNDTDGSDCDSVKVGTDDNASDDDTENCSVEELPFDEVDSDVEEKDAVVENKSNATSEMIGDEETVPNVIESKAKLGVSRNSQEIDMEKRLHLDFKQESLAATASSLCEYFSVSESRQTRTEPGEITHQTKDVVNGKGKKRKRSYYDSAFKLEVVQFAEKSGKKATEEKFGITEKVLDEWCKSKDSIENKVKNKRKGRNPPDFEEDLVLWIQDMQKSGSDISAKSVATQARLWRDEGEYDMDPFDYKFSDRWAQKFLERNGLVDRKENKVQKKARNNPNIDIPPELVGIPNQPLDNKMTRQSYDNAFKSSVISFAESSSNVLAVRVFKISEALVRKWRKSKEVILNEPKDKRRCVPKIPTFKELEKDLVSWCDNLQKGGKEITRRSVMLQARQLAKEGKYSVDTSQFKASAGWCTRFFDRNGYTSKVIDGRSRAGRQLEEPSSDSETDEIDDKH